MLAWHGMSCALKLRLGRCFNYLCHVGEYCPCCTQQAIVSDPDAWPRRFVARLGNKSLHDRSNAMRSLVAARRHDGDQFVGNAEGSSGGCCLWPSIGRYPRRSHQARIWHLRVKAGVLAASAGFLFGSPKEEGQRATRANQRLLLLVSRLAGLSWSPQKFVLLRRSASPPVIPRSRLHFPRFLLRLQSVRCSEWPSYRDPSPQ